ncbi:peptidase M23 [Hypericibacter terrae]|uniref:Peptidase M23 n=1 Tax=Hypericibacter terrae TaxID=2602015 RepID=A0A5J6MIU7_9PROT|nr:LysM peptidoglycan-binding domain-containing M23 family metallopeptidase [Hypericibacter terrae]QEX17384.1 peptidase M23 [Hypericibacter terrae]
MSPKFDRGLLKGLALGVALAATMMLAACNQSGRPAGTTGDVAAAAAPTAGTTDGAGNYTAVNGDTVYGVANRFKVPVRALIDENKLKPPYRLVTGQKLRIPQQDVYIAKAGDSVYSIADQFHVDQSQLIRFNQLKPPYTITAGQKILLPAQVQQPSDMPVALAAPSSAVTSVPLDAPPSSGGIATQPLPSATPQAVPQSTTSTSPSTTSTATQPAPMPAATPSVKPLTAPSASTTNQPAAVANIPQPTGRAGGFFQWPVNGKIISGFGATSGGLHNDGINIAAPRGTPVHAAENGVVVYAGNQLRGFGNLILIRHADGWVTAYAHNDTLLVKKGQQVKRGDVIARVGSTGNVSTPQLHFELRKGTEAVDPKVMLGAYGA